MAQSEPAGSPAQPAGGADGAKPSPGSAGGVQPAAGGEAAGAGAAVAAVAALQEPAEHGASIAPETLLHASSDEDGHASLPAGEQAPPALSAEELARRKRRREQWEREQEGKRRWDLARRLADISTDVEFLAREVERVRHEMEVPLPPLSELPEAERTQLESMRRKRLTDLLVNHCKKALGHITGHKWSWPFNSPVDTKQYPDYALTITRPMDFATIKRRIDAGPGGGGGTAGGGYRHPDEFLSDVRLVFDNARLYNKPGSDVHVMANTLQERFEERYSLTVAPRVMEEAALTRAQQEEARRRHLEASTQHSGDALEQHCAVLIKYIDEVSACILDARSAAAALCKPVSREEKEALVRALTAMPQEQFEAAVGLVMSHHPGLQAYDDLGFDLDALDALSLRQMQSFVRACEAAEAEAKQRGAPTSSLSVSWPQLLLGAGLRPYKPPPGSKRVKRQHGGSARQATAAPAPPVQEQQHQQEQEQEREQHEVQVKQEQVQQVQQQQQTFLPPPALPAPAGERLGSGLKRSLAELVMADSALPQSTLTPEEVAAAAAAAGMISPLVQPLPTLPLPPAGSAVAPKLLSPAGTAAAAAVQAPALNQQQQQQQQAKQQQAAGPTVGSNTPIAALGPAAAATTAAAAAAAPRAGPAAGVKAGQAAGVLPTPAQVAAVAASTPQQQFLLSQMHSMLTAAAAAGVAGSGKPAEGAPKQQQATQPQGQQQEKN